MEENNLDDLRHSGAHLLSAAILEIWPDTKNAIGPAIKDGFYYDFEFSAPVTDRDLLKIEKRMKKILPTWKSFEQKKVSYDEAVEIFKDNPYKKEIIDELNKKGEDITLYTSGNYTDLCRGGHAQNPSDLKHFKLLSIAGAYWRGDEKNKMLTRIYGTLFPTEEELQTHVDRLEEAKKRDHRKIGKELDLFVFSPIIGSGLPLFTPKGTLIRDLLDAKVWSLREKYGYERVDIPHITKKDLYEKSGHWEKFGDELFGVKSREGHEFVLKPMNCPHHTQIYDRRPHSYKELPVRYSNTTKVYRDEQTGELGGLSRVRSITQDDAHVFCRKNQIEEEVEKIWDIVTSFYTAVGFSGLTATLSLHDPQNKDAYLGDTQVWIEAEEVLRKITQKRQGDVKEFIGEAAFYGPKIDFLAADSLGREVQVATIQLDMNMPERFNLTCMNEKGEKERIVMIHAAIMGSIERFLAVYIEHVNGIFPLWLSPIQIAILPISEKHIEHAEKVNKELVSAGYRTKLYDDDATLGKKIREVKTQKIPYFLVIGDAEQKDLTVKAESLDGSFSESMSMDHFVDHLSHGSK